MAEYYVNPTSGSDSWNGSSGSPWRTPRHAASAAALVPGDNVNYASGTYAISSDITALTSGSSTSALITHRATSARGAVFQVSGSTTTAYFGTNEAYIRFEGIRFVGTGASAGNNSFLRWSGGSYIQYYNCTVENAYSHGWRFYGGCTNFLLDTCEAFHTAIIGAAGGKDPVSIDGAGTAGSVVNFVCYNWVEHGGLYCDASGSAWVNGYTAYDTESHGLEVENAYLNATNIIIYRSGAVNNPDPSNSGVFIKGSATAIISRAQIYNTTGMGIMLKDFTGAASIMNCSFYANGTSASSGSVNGTGIYYNNAASTSGTVYVANNIFYHTRPGRLHYFAHTGSGSPSAASRITWNTNLYYVSGASQSSYWFGTTYTTLSSWISARESDAINSDPLYTDAANAEFTLLSSSPAINVGTVISGITDGYFGAAPEIGYWEYEPSTGGSPSAGATTTAVSAPVFGRLTMYIS